MTVRPDIAIVGLGCVFPGAADAAGFWSLINAATCVAGQPPAGRWPDDPQSYRADQLSADRIVSSRACFVDPLPPLNAPSLPGLDTSGLDPLFHLLLHAGRQAWNDAKTDRLNRAKCGVILGQIVLPSEALSNWSDALLRRATDALWGEAAAPPPAFNPLNRYVAGLPAGLLAAALDLGGGASCLDAACASSLYALKLAIDELNDGRRDAMLVGGLSRPDSLYTQMGFSHLQALSISGNCRPFSRNADGLMVGEGAGMVVLKRLEDALECGDHIYATVPGIGLSNDIGGNLMHPDSEGQLRAMRQAYERAGWQPENVDLIECHGTGTPTGDRVELASLRQLWSAVPAENNAACVIGSVKSNIGHLLTAAGIAGLIKVLLAMQAEKLPPSANVDQPLPDLQTGNGPFRIISQSEPWPLRGQRIPRRAAVSAFGFGGINAHVLVEQWSATPNPSAGMTARRLLAAPPAHHEPVAVVGLSGQFGPWTDPAAFTARMLADPRAQAAPGPGRQLAPGENPDIAGYSLNSIRIDSLRFRIPPRELEQLLPQQALMLQTAADALDDAGVATDHDAHLTSGVYVGIELDMNTCNFHWRWQCERLVRDRQLGSECLDGLKDAAGPYLSADRTMGALGGIVASRIARWLGAGAGSFSVSCEQASALKALEIALRALRREEIDLAVVGGVDLNAEPRALQARAEIQSSTIFGEGAGAVILKRHNDALRDGDRIYCLLRGVSQRSVSRQSNASRAEHYQHCLRETLSDAGMKSIAPGLLELGGTHGRSPAELQALQTGLREVAPGHSASLSQALSSSVEVLGDTGAACGIAALLRVALCLHYRVVPATPTPKRGSPEQKPEGFYQPDESHYWLRNRAQGPRQALLSVDSLLGGTTQLIVEGVDTLAQPPLVAPGSLLCIHGRDPETLLSAIENCRQQLQRATGVAAAAIADQWHQFNRREAGDLTVSLVAEKTTQLIALLGEARDCVTSGTRPQSTGLYYEPEPLTAGNGRLAFVFSGSGNQYRGMCRQLSLPAAPVLDQSDSRNQYLLDQFAGGAFWRDTPISEQDHTRLLLSQIWSSTFVYDIFQHLGVRTEAMIGYSLGETASLYASGCWPQRDLMLERILDTDLFTHQLGSDFAAVRAHWGLPPSAPVDWRMAMIQAPVARIREALSGAYAKHRIYLLIINTASECVVGGDGATLNRFASELGVVLHPVNGVTSVHCEVVQPVADAYRKLHLQKTQTVAGISHYSCHLGRRYEVNRETAADSILGMALQAFDFSKVIESAYADGVRMFVETGPGDACTRMIDTILGPRPHLACSASHSKAHEYLSLLQSLARIAAHGVVLETAKWSQHHCAPDRRRQPQQVLTLAPGLQAWQVPVRPVREPLAEIIELERPATAAVATVPIATGSDWPTPVVHGMLATLESRHQAHQAYLELQSSIEQSLSEALQLRLKATPSTQSPVTAGGARKPVPGNTPERSFDAVPVVFERADCLRFAVGGIAQVLGPEFADIDHYPTRVRLPDEPLMLVDRITAIEGQIGKIGPARIITEHDIEPGAWYLDANRIPTCIAVEAGQADLFLCAWLGIDRLTRGQAVYRLLDANITFFDQLPGPGKRIRYDIRINRFYKLGATHLFQFEFDASVDGKPLLSMRDGSAGFFSQAELDAGQGIVDSQALPGLQAGNTTNSHSDWLAPPVRPGESYTDAQLSALREGDLASCFGAQFDALPWRQAETLPSGRMRLVHRVLAIRMPQGEQPGSITGEADIHPRDWFLTCHFIDDQVMPGTLMYECCLHTLRIYLLRMGWIGEQGQVAYQSVPDCCSKLKCRGQVVATTRTVQYQITVRETAWLADGSPYAIADALMLADGQPIVEMRNMSLCLRGLDRAAIEGLWQPAIEKPIPATDTVLFDQASILAYAQGRPSEGFGARYQVFDEQRVLARLPRPPYLFMDQVEQIEHCEQWCLSAGGEIKSSHGVQPRDWYFAANRQQAVPLAILMEIALQPCGWLAAYLGSALSSDTDLSFRNLDGQATLHRPLTQRSGRIRVHTRINKVSRSGGMIIQTYSVSLHDAAGPLYNCETVFGFFSKTALRQQIGIREAQWYAVENVAASASRPRPYPTQAPFPDSGLRMLNDLSVLSLTGGRHGLGWVEGHAPVDMQAWYFKAHFYQDPVIPGSLGIESMVQLLKVYALERWSHLKNTEPSAALFQCPAPGIEMRWTYRGQVLPGDGRVSVQIHLARVDTAHAMLIADGYLAVDGRIIYSVENLSLSLRGGT